MSSALDLLAARTPVSDQALLASIDRGEVASAPLSQTTPQTAAVPVSEDFFTSSSLNSSGYNRFFTGVATDLVRLFAATNDNAERIGAIETLGVDDLSKIAAQLDILEARISAIKDLQLGYNLGFTIYSRVDFIDDSAIDLDPALLGGSAAAAYDPMLQAISLSRMRDVDVIHTSNGSTVVDAEIDLQLGLPIAAYDHVRTPAHALDTSETSYWSEVVLADSPIEVPWPPSNSVYGPAAQLGALVPITSGAVCEFTLNFRQPQSWDQLTIKPFCELPINLAAVFCVKRDVDVDAFGSVRIGNADRTGYGRYLLSEYGIQRDGQGRLFLNQAARLYYPVQEDALSVTLVFHQPHYTREVFSLPAGDAAQAALWDQMLRNTPLLGVPGVGGLDLTYSQPTDVVGKVAAAVGAQIDGTLTSAPTAVHSHTKYQYVYGAYDIGLRDRRFNEQAVFVSTPLTSNSNLMQGALIADYDVPVTTPTVSALFAGDRTVIPAGFTVPAATIKFELTFGQGEPWFALAALDEPMVHEALVFQTNMGQTPSAVFPSLQARPGTPVIVTSFDGLGMAQIVYAGAAPSVAVQAASGINLANNQLAEPGYYCISYTPLDTSRWVDFGSLAEAGGSTSTKTVNFTDKPIPQLVGFKLPSEPYIDPNRIPAGFEPNGNSLTEYVPLTVTLSNLPITFPNLVDATGHPRTIASFGQDLSHANDLYVNVPVQLETLYSSSGDATAAQRFTAQHGNWSQEPSQAPQVFAIAPNSAPALIAPFDGSGQPVYTVDYSAGSINFLGAYAATSGEIAVTYWYGSGVFDTPRIVNRTDFTGAGNAALRAFDAASYPVIEYVLVGDKIYFNLDIPGTAVATVTYGRLFDEVRVRATLTRIDPSNAAATPHLYGYTFLARDANGTSLPTLERPEVVWGDLELEALGTTTQNNPGIGIIAGNNQSAGGLPVLTQFNWYRIVNAGSVRDTLRTNYDGSNGTTVFWDWTGQRYIQPDGGISREQTYRVMNVDGSNTIELDPGAEVVLGICNFLVPPGTPHSINAAVVYSGQNADFLQTEDWLLQAQSVTQATSIDSVVIS